jgi:hypothetical protein
MQSCTRALHRNALGSICPDILLNGVCHVCLARVWLSTKRYWKRALEFRRGHHDQEALTQSWQHPDEYIKITPLLQPRWPGMVEHSSLSILANSLAMCMDLVHLHSAGATPKQSLVALNHQATPQRRQTQARSQCPTNKRLAKHYSPMTHAQLQLPTGSMSELYCLGSCQ